MTKQLRRLLTGVLAIAAVTACDDSTDPVATAPVEVLAYVDMDASGDFDGTTDEPIEGATVTLTMVGASSGGLEATTGAGGIASFDAVEVGSYTATIELPASVSGVTLTSAAAPSVVVSGDQTAEASFRYTYNPGSISGHAFLGTGDYADGATVVPGLTVTASAAGMDDLTTETDAAGAYTFDGLLPGDYTVSVSPPAFLVAESGSETVILAAEADETVDFAFSAEATHTIAQARAAAADDTVAVEGVAITGTAGTEAVLSGSSFYMQDEAGISIFLADVDAAVELGDRVLVYGTRGAFNDEVQIASLSVLNLGDGTLPTPVTVTPTEINAGDYQGQLGLLDDVLVDSAGENNVYVSDLETGVGTVVYVDDDAGIDVAATFLPGSVYDVTGVVARFRDLMELKPRMPSDVVEETTLPTTIADVRAAAENTPVEVTAVVTEAGDLEGNGFYIQDATAGIFVFTGGGNVPAGLAIGDVVTVSGDRAQFFSIAQIGGTVTVTETGEVVTPDATPVSVAVLNSGDVQGQLVVMSEVVVSTIDGSNLYVKEDAAATDSAVVRIDSDSGISAASFVAGDTYTFTGVVSNFGGTEQLKPRFPEDVEGIEEIEPVTTVAEARAAVAGTPVELTGVVTVTNGPSGMLDSRNSYMQDGTAGILIRMPTDSVVELGDSVTVTGTTGAFNSELQVSVDGLTRLGTGTIPAPRVVTPADIEAGSYQGELAILENVEVTEINGASITVTDGSTSTIVYIDGTTGIDEVATFTVGNSYDITGVVSRFNDIFELKPRQQSDIVEL